MLLSGKIGGSNYAFVKMATCLILLSVISASRTSNDVVEEAETFLSRLRALWKSSGGNPIQEPTEINKFRNKNEFGWRQSSEEEYSPSKSDPRFRTKYRQLKVPVRLGLVRFSPRKPTALPQLNSDHSFPVLMPSEPNWVNNFTTANHQAALYRLITKDSLSRQRIKSKRSLSKRNSYFPEPDELPHETDASLQEESEQASRRDGSRWSDYFSGPEVAHDVCPSVSDWVARSEALDPYGNRLTVLQRIPVNGTVVNQYFFETYCASSAIEAMDNVHSAYYSSRTLIECRGINKKLWNSRCKENFIWTYGKVITVSGDIGWSVIAIRGSCGCAIWRKGDELVGRRRRLMSRKPPNKH